MNLIKHQQPDGDKIHLIVRGPFEVKYQLLTNGIEKVGIKELKNPKAFIDDAQTVDDIYENLEGYNPTKKRKLFVVFDDMIAEMEPNTKLSPIVPELFISGRKLNISLVCVL